MSVYLSPFCVPFLERLALVFPSLFTLSHSIHLFSLEALRLRVIEQEGITHQFDLVLLCGLIFIRFLSLTLEGLGRELGISVNLAMFKLDNGGQTDFKLE